MLSKILLSFSIILISILLTGTPYSQPLIPRVDITDVNPNKGKVGDSVVITGKGFGDERGTVLFGETEATVISWSDVKIIVAISLGSSSGKLKIITPLTNGEHPFTIIPSWNLYPSPTNTFLKAIALRSPRDGWLIEKTGQGNFFHFNGKLWEGVEKDVNCSCIGDICFLPSGEGWAVGGGGSIIYFNGKSWERVADALTRDDLNDVFFLSPTDGWAVGSTGRIIHYFDWTVKDISWRKENTLSVFDTLYAIHFISPEKGWAMGQNGTILEYHNKQWVSLTSPTGSVLYSMDFASENNGWAVGAFGTIIHYNGRAWVSYVSPVKENLNSICMISDDNGWIVGDRGTILHYNGNDWIQGNSPSIINLHDIYFIAPDTGWAVGEEGVILYYH